MAKSPTERRRSKRAPADLPITIDSSTGRLKARVRDLSNSGICFFLPEPMPEMTAVKVDLELPIGGKIEKISGDGAVVRCQRIASGVEHYEVAIFFTHLRDEGKKILDGYVTAKLPVAPAQKA